MLFKAKPGCTGAVSLHLSPLLNDNLSRLCLCLWSLCFSCCSVFLHNYCYLLVLLHVTESILFCFVVLSCGPGCVQQFAFLQVCGKSVLAWHPSLSPPPCLYWPSSLVALPMLPLHPHLYLGCVHVCHKFTFSFGCGTEDLTHSKQTFKH